MLAAERFSRRLSKSVTFSPALPYSCRAWAAQTYPMVGVTLNFVGPLFMPNFVYVCIVCNTVQFHGVSKLLMPQLPILGTEISQSLKITRYAATSPLFV